MSIPRVMGARAAFGHERQALSERLRRAVDEPECRQALRVVGVRTFNCTREEGHGGLCVAHDESGGAVAVSRWARRR